MDRATQPLSLSAGPTDAQHDAVTRVALTRLDVGKDDPDQFLTVLAHLGIDPAEVQARWKAQKGAA